MNLSFPKRAYGGIWNGKLVWGNLTYGRVLQVLKNPSYAGVYAFGRYQVKKNISDNGDIQSQSVKMPMNDWKVKIMDHHEGYISWESFLKNQEILKKNQTNGEDTLSSPSAREGKAILQGLIICGKCGRRVSARYKGNGGIYPMYECNKGKMENQSGIACLSVRADFLDEAVSNRILEIIQTKQIKIAIKAFEKLSERENSIDKQWELKLERAEYEAQLAQKRYEEVDPSNRLVAATLENRWESALNRIEELKIEYDEFRKKQQIPLNQEQKKKLLALAKDIPRLWQAKSTKEKDRKRILQLLIKDITLEKCQKNKKAILHIRWQGGATEDIRLDLPKKAYEKYRYSQEMVDTVRKMAKSLSDSQIAKILNQEGKLSSKGKPFSKSMISWIRYTHSIPPARLKHVDELTVNQVMEKFGVSRYVVYYWIEREIIQARRVNNGAPYWITLDNEKEKELENWVQNSKRL